MIEQFAVLLGEWSWVVLGLVLLGAEIVLPSTFLLWPGIAALIVGVITLIVGEGDLFWVWQTQLLVFLVLTIVVALLGRTIMKRKRFDQNENPTLNERGANLVGQTAVLTDAIENGVGRIRIGDTTWRVTGEDTAEGIRVRITYADGATLGVEEV